MKNSSLISYLLAFVVFFQNPPWIIWNIYYHIISIFLMIIILLVCNRRFVFSDLSSFFIFTLSVFYFCGYHFMYELRVSSVMTLLSFIIILNLKDIELQKGLIYLRDILFIVLSISLFFWALNNILELYQPLGVINYSLGKGDGGQTVLNNYIFYIEETKSIFPRFYSVFDEPGVLGTLSVFILFAFKFDLKDYKNFVIFFAACCTFSLAFYLLSFISILLLNFHKPKTYIYVLGFLVIGYFVYIILNDFTKSFDSLVINRLINYNDHGINQRISYSLNQYYSNFIISKNVVFGMGSNFFILNPNLLSGQGYRVFVIEYGYFGVFLVLLLYIKLISKVSWYTFVSLMIFFLSFLQRPFLFTPWQFILFSMIISNYNIQYLTKLNNPNVHD